MKMEEKGVYNAYCLFPYVLTFYFTCISANTSIIMLNVCVCLPCLLSCYLSATHIDRSALTLNCKTLSSLLFEVFLCHWGSSGPSGHESIRPLRMCRGVWCWDVSRRFFGCCGLWTGASTDQTWSSSDILYVSLTFYHGQHELSSNNIGFYMGSDQTGLAFCLYRHK